MRTGITLVSVLVLLTLLAVALLMCHPANAQETYQATIWGWDYIQGWGSPVPITLDGVATGYSTPTTFNLTGTHTFTVPSLNSENHPFSDWDIGGSDWTDPTVTVSSAGVYTARYREGYSVTVWAWCASEQQGWVARPITLDGSYTGYSTPRSFYLIGTHTIEVPNYDESGHKFYGWNEGTSSSPTLTVNSAGVFTAKYRGAPTGSIVINGGSTYTTSTSVTLSLTYEASAQPCLRCGTATMAFGTPRSGSPLPLLKHGFWLLHLGMARRLSFSKSKTLAGW